MKIRTLLFALTLSALSFQSCKDEGNDGPSCLDNYPIAPLLEEYSSELIVPAYSELVDRVDELSTEATSLFDGPTIAQLDITRAAFKDAYMAYQRVEPFNFGPAESLFFSDHVNNFPLNESAFVRRVNTGDFDFSSPDTYDKGFPALDYLFFGVDTADIGLIDSFTTRADRYKAATMAVIGDIQRLSREMLSKWETEGYAADFTGNTGVSAGQPFSNIVNSLNQHFETIRRNRIGIPSGALSLNFANPDEVEALYSGWSKELALESIKASYAYFTRGGDIETKSTGGEGLDDVLDFINAQKNESGLSGLILDGYFNAYEAVEAIPETLSKSTENNQQTVLDAYKELSPMVILLKSDLPSVMCIAITYVDNPSDSD